MNWQFLKADVGIGNKNYQQAYPLVICYIAIENGHL